MATLVIKRHALILLFCVLAISCKVVLLSPYDEVTDKTITEMQQSTSTFFAKHASDPLAQELSYTNQKGFYNDLRVKSATLRIRNNAVEKNKPMVGMIHLLEQNIGLMDSLHQSKPNGLLSSNDVSLLKNAFEMQYTAMMKFVMGLKSRAKSDTQ